MKITRRQLRRIIREALTLTEASIPAHSNDSPRRKPVELSRKEEAKTKMAHVTDDGWVTYWVGGSTTPGANFQLSDYGQWKPGLASQIAKHIDDSKGEVRRAVIDDGFLDSGYVSDTVNIDKIYYDS